MVLKLKIKMEIDQEQKEKKKELFEFLIHDISASFLKSWMIARDFNLLSKYKVKSRKRHLSFVI